ncbi:unnamed protein product [Rhizophagus irregularis]|nr:unnamed protein product [Rhizophagus irregularis]
MIFTLDAMKNNEIDIYGLAETNLSHRQSKIWQQQFGFHGYFDITTRGQRKMLGNSGYINANKKERTQIEELYQYYQKYIDEAKIEYGNSHYG